MEYDQLMSEYKRLLIENNELMLENECLRKQLNMPIKAVANMQTKQNVLHHQSTSEEKIRYFMSLFIGRADVYAKRWYSLKTEKSGYQPVCGNEWSEDFCDKRKFKCSNCPNRMLLPINEKAIDLHLRGNDTYGRDVVGIYPMLSDETCRLLAIDFDESEYREDVLAFAIACKVKEVPVYIERSRSGNGAHVWIFFDENIPAHLARQLGSRLLTFAMKTRSGIKFKSYDRLFPNQDTMPSGGFGNLIALPLQGLARKQGNSVFVDEDFVPYKDQWAYLAQIQKLSASNVEKLVSDLGIEGDLGVLVQDSSEKESKPWDKVKETPLCNSDFSVKVNIVRANMLYIEKEGISQIAQNRIKRLGAFKNPEFYKAQAMRLPTYDKPRILTSTEETSDYIGIPRGVETELLKVIDDANANYFIDDKTNNGKSISVTFNGVLFDEQSSAAKVMLSHNIGVLSATTAFGKTVISANMIANRKVNTLVLVHTQALLSQWKKSLEQFLNFDYTPIFLTNKRGKIKMQSIIGELGAGENRLGGIVDIAIMQSLFKVDEVKDLVRNYGMIIVDECHHVSAVHFEKILKYANAKYIYGLTATPTRQDGHHPIIFMQCGEIRYRVDAKLQAYNRPFEHYIIPRFTSLRTGSLQDGNKITQIYNDLTNNEPRNRLIVEDVEAAIKCGRNPIILTERAEHVSVISKMLEGKCNNILKMTGSLSIKEKRDVMKRLEELPDDSSFVIVATGKYVGEGFDYPRLDTLFLAMPIAWKGKVSQYAGRLHRLYTRKEEVLIYDYIDVHVPVLERMYHKRVKGYAAIGYKIRTMEHQLSRINLIYETNNFLPVFCADIKTAEKEVIIVSPNLRKTRLTQIIKMFSKVETNEKLVTVYTKPPEDFNANERIRVEQNTNYLRSENVTVVYKSNLNLKFAVLDKRIVWFGSVDFLGFGKSEESIMRLESNEIAEELLDLIKENFT